MTPEEIKAIQDKVNAELEGKFSKQDAALKSMLNEAIETAVDKLEKGMIKKEDFQPLIDAALKEYGEKATNLEKVLREQGDILNGMKEKLTVNVTKQATMKSILEPHIAAIKEIRKNEKGFIRIDFKDIENIKAVNSVTNSVTGMTSPPTSPYAPGISNVPLSVYDIMRNPLFVSNYVNMGRTDQSRMAWINETSLTGLPALVQEGAQKPNSSRTWQVEFSAAKKIADYIQVTEEFDKDLNYLYNQTENLLQMDVARAFDLQVQVDVIAAATQLNLTTQLGPNNVTLAAYKNQIFDATLWDALYVYYTAVRLANFVPNVSLINPVTMGKMVMSKDAYGRYNTPPQEMVSRINAIDGNNLFADFGIVGDLKQFNVFIYEDFSLKIGYINDDLIRNQFTVVSEVRFHDFISTARKQAIMYGDIKWMAEAINGGSNVIIGS